MIFKLTIDSSKTDKILSDLMARSRNLRPALVHIEGILDGASKDAFEQEGPHWKSLKLATEQQRIKGGWDADPILKRDGDLLRSVNTRILGNNTVMVGTGSEYGAIHQHGGTIKHKGTDNGFGKGIKIPPHDIKIPARPFLIVGKKEIEASKRALKKHILGK